MELILNDVFKLNENEYVTHLSGEKLLSMWNNKEIVYIPEIQRGSIVKYDKENNAVETPVYSDSNVKKIYNAMLAGNYYSDMITINVFRSEGNKLEYKDNGLKLNVNVMAISDGHHRIKALEMIEALNAKNETKFDLNSLNFAIKISNLEVQDAQQQFYQFSQGLKISSSRSEYFNQKDLPNILIKKLMDKGNALDGLVEVVKNNIAKADKQHIVTFATIVNATKAQLCIENEKELEKWVEFLNEYFKEIIALIPELRDYELRKSSKQTSFIGENFMFYGYITIAKLLYGNKEWKEKLPLILKLDLNKNSESWYGKVTKQLKDDVYSIINNNESRKIFINKIEKDFKNLIS